MKPEEYFPRPPGEEPFLPPFSGAAKPEKPEERVKKKIPRVCADCGEVYSEIEMELSKESASEAKETHGRCPECHAKVLDEFLKGPDQGSAEK